MNQKHYQSIYHVNVNANLMVQNVTQIKFGIRINLCGSVKIKKSIVYPKKDHIWNPTTYSRKNGKYLTSIIDDSVITYDEIINRAKAAKTKTVLKKYFNKFLYFTCLFIDYHCIIDSR